MSKGTVEIDRRDNGRWHWFALSRNKIIVSNGTNSGYKTKRSCIEAAAKYAPKGFQIQLPEHHD
jgi:uncharacterized protein YegP (UPF0339 family)